MFFKLYGSVFRKSCQTIVVKKFGFALLLLGAFSACKHSDRQLVSKTLIDSLIRHFTPPVLAVQNERESTFWRERINPAAPGYLNESRYAAALSMDFRLFGRIDSLEKADSILLAVDRHFNHKEASADLAMVAHCVTQHRFMTADSFLQQARHIGLRPYESLSTSFDVDFELGRYANAKSELNALRSPDDYGYYFRKSKMDHLDGELDSSIHDMIHASDLAGSSGYLKDVALANAGDLCIHAEDLTQARDIYIQCIRMNSADFHSLMGLGWIALVHDQDDSLAETIFRFVQSRSGLPDPLFKLSQTAGVRHDSIRQEAFARAFAQKATDPVYGRMYNKYLIQLYTGILHDPARAESMAKDELNNRATPQTYAWYAWALLANHKPDQAYAVYRQYVSGKPLEALELYWMGRLMESLNKNYNALAFYKAAGKTHYDLDPADAKYIQEKLAE